MALFELTSQLYGELRTLASSVLGDGGRGVSLHKTLLVHEAYLRLVRQAAPEIRGRSHFFALAATAMRHFLIDHHRGRTREKRGGDHARVGLSEDRLSVKEVTGTAAAAECDSVEAALHELAQVDPRGAQVVRMRFFAGMKETQIAEALGISERTVQNDWRVARAWLRRALERSAAENAL